MSTLVFCSRTIRSLIFRSLSFLFVTCLLERESNDIFTITLVTWFVDEKRKFSKLLVLFINA